MCRAPLLKCTANGGNGGDNNLNQKAGTRCGNGGNAGSVEIFGSANGGNGGDGNENNGFCGTNGGVGGFIVSGGSANGGNGGVQHGNGGNGGINHKCDSTILSL